MTTMWDDEFRVRPRGSSVRWLALALVASVVLGGVAMASSYKKLVVMDQSVQSEWAQVQNVYQRRLDLVPSLVSAVPGALAFERDTFAAVVEARSHTEHVMSGVWHAAPSDPDTLARFDTAQDGLARSLQRLMIVVEGVPDLRATEPFRGLRTQLEGAENTIAAERMRFNEASRAFNTARNRFSAVVMTGFFGSRFAAKPYFRAAARAEIAPAVQR